MPLETSLLDRLLHLSLFISAGITVGVVALAVLERVGGPDRRIIRLRHVAWPAGAFFLLYVAERLYHALE